MSNIQFHSYKPFLQLSFKDAGLCITFNADCTYTPQNKRELRLLREYTETTKKSCTISESIPLAELQSRHKAFEDLLIQEAEARATAKKAAEEKRKEDHDFYSTLRMADKAYR